MSQLEIDLSKPMNSGRLVLASQLCESKPNWRDDNGREASWKVMGGLVAGWMARVEESERFGEYNAMMR